MLKKPIFVAIPALLAVLALALAACGHSQTKGAAELPCARHGSAFARPCLSASPSAPPPATTVGIADPDLITESAPMKAIGITSIRLDANWDWVQYGGKNTFDWGQLDQVVESVRAAGMSVDLI